MPVMSMLNTKYIIIPDSAGQQAIVQRNPGAMGSAWLVKSIRYVPSPATEMKALDYFDPSARSHRSGKIQIRYSFFTCI